MIFLLHISLTYECFTAALVHVLNNHSSFFTSRKLISTFICPDSPGTSLWDNGCPCSQLFSHTFDKATPHHHLYIIAVVYDKYEVRRELWTSLVKLIITMTARFIFKTPPLHNSSSIYPSQATFYSQVWRGTTTFI